MLAECFDVTEGQAVTVSSSKGWKVHTVSPHLSDPAFADGAFSTSTDSGSSSAVKSQANTSSRGIAATSPLDHSMHPISLLANDSLAVSPQPQRMDPANVKYPWKSMAKDVTAGPSMEFPSFPPGNSTAMTFSADNAPAVGLHPDAGEPVNAASVVQSMPTELTTAVQTAAAVKMATQQDGQKEPASNGQTAADLPADQVTLAADSHNAQHSFALDRLTKPAAAAQPESSTHASAEPQAVLSRSSDFSSLSAVATAVSIPAKPSTCALEAQAVETASVACERTSSDGFRTTAPAEEYMNGAITKPHAARISSAAVTTDGTLAALESTASLQDSAEAADAAEGTTNGKTIVPATVAAGTVASTKTAKASTTAASKRDHPVTCTAEPQGSAPTAAAAELSHSKASASAASPEQVAAHPAGKPSLSRSSSTSQVLPKADVLPKHRYGTRSACAAVASKAPSGIATMASKQPVVSQPPSAIPVAPTQSSGKLASNKQPAVTAAVNKPPRASAVAKTQPSARAAVSKGSTAKVPSSKSGKPSEHVQQKAPAAGQALVTRATVAATKQPSGKATASRDGQAGGVSGQQGPAVAVKRPVTRAAARQQSKAGPASAPSEPAVAEQVVAKPKRAGTTRQKAMAGVADAKPDAVSTAQVETLRAGTTRAACAAASAVLSQKTQADAKPVRGVASGKAGCAQCCAEVHVMCCMG